jgi:hypothetical protein
MDMTTKMSDVKPPDCFARLARLGAEVELLRAAMGRPAESRPRASVSGAAPREVYFAALAAARKAERLCEEITGDVPAAARAIAAPASLPGILPGHVLQIADGALAAVLAVKQRLGVVEDAKPAARDDAKVPSDCLVAAVAASRQLDLLLARPISPGDVHQLLALAAANAPRYVEAPREHHRTPGDVYDRLLAAARHLRPRLVRAGLTTFEAPPARPEATRPSDCYDLAAILFGNAASLATHQALVPFPVGPAGNKLPSDCYQLAAALELAWQAES